LLHLPYSFPELAAPAAASPSVTSSRTPHCQAETGSRCRRPPGPDVPGEREYGERFLGLRSPYRMCANYRASPLGWLHRDSHDHSVLRGTEQARVGSAWGTGGNAEQANSIWEGLFGPETCLNQVFARWAVLSNKWPCVVAQIGPNAQPAKNAPSSCSRLLFNVPWDVVMLPSNALVWEQNENKASSRIM
jgi:hypothetical protein